MKVTVIDVAQPDRQLAGDYRIDTTFGPPVIGDEIYLRERDYNTDRYYATGVVRRRRWVFSDNTPEGAELVLWIQQSKR